MDAHQYMVPCKVSEQHRDNKWQIQITNRAMEHWADSACVCDKARRKGERDKIKYSKQRKDLCTMTHTFGFLFFMSTCWTQNMNIYAAAATTLDLGNSFLDMYVSPVKAFFGCPPKKM